MKQNSPAVFLLRESAIATAMKLRDGLNAEIVNAWESSEKPIELFRQQFTSRSAWILIMSTGIAVRFLDGLIKDKHTDPAVVVVDEGCHHAVALLSGHEGGANELAFKVANILSATPVISTATEALKPLVIGVGCRKDITAEAIASAVKLALGDRKLSEVRCIATIDLKANEPGLLEFSRNNSIPLRVFPRNAVAARNWVTKPSDWVEKNVGLSGVCEPCALMATSRGRLVVSKTTLAGVAVAIVDDSIIEDSVN